MTRLHKLELAYARARIARGKLRNARSTLPKGAWTSEWDSAERLLDGALRCIDGLIIREKQRMKEAA